MKELIFSIYTLLTFNFLLNAQELIIGEERVEPGILVWNLSASNKVCFSDVLDRYLRSGGVLGAAAKILVLLTALFGKI